MAKDSKHSGNEDQVTPTEQRPASETISRRDLVLLMGGFGAAALSGCAGSDGKEFASRTEALTGTNLLWTDTIGTVAAPGELRGQVGAAAGQMAVAFGFWSRGDGGGGIFYWDRASTAADNGGTVIKATASTTGRWKRLSVADDGIFNVKYFGATGVGGSVNGVATANNPTDDTAGVLAAIVAIEQIPQMVASYSSDSATLYFPRGVYKLNQTLNIRRTMRVKGDISTNAGSTVYLQWTTNVHGFTVQGSNVLTKDQGGGSIIEGLNIQGASTQPLPPNPPWTGPGPGTQMDDPITSAGAALGSNNGCGICIFAGNVKVRNCTLANWLYDAIHIESVDSFKNANDFEVSDCFITACGRHGIFVCGGNNSNAGMVQRVIGTGSIGGYTIYDRSFLGNTYIACHSEGAVHSYYTSNSPTNNCTLVGCYQESSDGPAQLGSGTMVVGGTWGNGYNGSPGFLATIPGKPSALRGWPVASPLQPPLRTIVRDPSLPQTQQPVYSVTAQDYTVLIDSHAGYCVIILPDPRQNLGVSLAIKRIDTTTNIVWVEALNGQLIEGSALLVPSASQGFILQSDGIQWRALAKYS